MRKIIRKNNFLGLSNELCDYKSSKIVIVPVPFGKKSIYSKGPGNIISESHRISLYDEEQSTDIVSEKRISTVKPVNLNNISVNKALDRIKKEVSKHIEAGKFPVIVGGSHSITASVLEAYENRYDNLSILQIGAHANLIMDNVKNYSQESVMARIAEFNKNIVQVGERSISRQENEFRKQKGIRTFFTREIKMGMYGENWQELILRNLSQNVYITFNLDGFDPSVFPAVEFPEPGGLFWDETMNLLKIAGIEKNIVGFDVTGFIPSKNYQHSGYTAAKLIYKILNYAFNKH